MLSEYLQTQGTLYTSGVMSAEEREQFELILEFHPELRDFVSESLDVSAALTLATVPRASRLPAPGLKSRLAGLIAGRPQQTSPEGVVMCDPNRVVQWVNPAFSEMCGYSLEELRGRNLGPILQGEKTDRATAERMRRAVFECRPCRESILNYHKNGTPYWVEIAISPIFDDADNLLWFVARERELTDRAAA